jgi:hypothetical protein
METPSIYTHEYLRTADSLDDVMFFDVLYEEILAAVEPGTFSVAMNHCSVG